MKLVLIFLLFFTSLFASRDGGPYLGLGYGISQYYDNGFNDKIKDDLSQTLSLYAGAYINQHLSVELGYTDFDADGQGSGFLVVDNSAIKKNISFSAITISTLAHYAFYDDTIDFYVRFGAGEITQNSLTGEGFTMIYGAGVSYRFNEYVSVKLALDTYQFGYDENSDKSSDYRMGLDNLYIAIEVQF